MQKPVNKIACSYFPLSHTRTNIHYFCTWPSCILETFSNVSTQKLLWLCSYVVFSFVYTSNSFNLSPVDGSLGRFPIKSFDVIVNAVVNSLARAPWSECRGTWRTNSQKWGHWGEKEVPVWFWWQLTILLLLFHLAGDLQCISFKLA